MVDVFISYPRAERARVEPIREKLEALDLDLFFDLDNIDGGATFPDVIDKALRASRVILCCWSPLYFQRPWCMIECRAAIARGLLVPVAMEAFDRLAPPAELWSVNYFNLTDWNGEDAHEDWNRTLRDLGAKLGRPLAPVLAHKAGGGLEAGPTPAAPAVASARADLIEDLRRTWASFPAKEDRAIVERFLERVRGAAPGSGLEFEIEHQLDLIARAEVVERERHTEEERQRRLVDERRRQLSTPGAVFRDVLRNGGDGPEMAVIPAGRFTMGSPENEPQREPWKEGVESPQHEVTIESPFAMGRYTVTRGEFATFVAATGHDMSGGIRWFDGKEWKSHPAKSWRNPGFAQDDRHPVGAVSCEDAERYCAWLSDQTGEAYRLPSEAEWEYACRAGSTAPFWWGSSVTPNQANYDGNYVYQGGGEKGVYRQKTEPVDAFAPNPWGLYQVHGNVEEWCADAWNDSYEGAPNDGSTWTTGDTSLAVLRGGSWNDNPQFLRSANRFKGSRDIRNSSIGFRISRTLRE